MTTTIQLTLANAEVNRLFTQKLPNDVLFYEAVMRKVSHLLTRCRAQHAYALLALYEIQKAIQRLTTLCYDDIDKFEGLLDKKNHLKGKTFHFAPRFQVEVKFDSAIAADLVEFFGVYDRLFSMIKTLRVAGCFVDDETYYTNLRRYFKATSRMLSQIQLTPLQTMPDISFSDVIDNTINYQQILASVQPIDLKQLYQAMISNLAPRIEEKIRQPLLARLKQQIESTVIEEIIPFVEAVA